VHAPQKLAHHTFVQGLVIFTHLRLPVKVARGGIGAMQLPTLGPGLVYRQRRRAARNTQRGRDLSVDSRLLRDDCLVSVGT
jgi:hypothetical protein